MPWTFGHRGQERAREQDRHGSGQLRHGNRGHRGVHANIAALLDEANKADSAAHSVAVKKASSPGVKKFARMMMGEHHVLRLAGEKAVKQANITPSAPANDPVAPLAQQETSVLDSTPAGSRFDRAYIDREVAAHRATKDLLQRSEGKQTMPTSRQPSARRVRSSTDT